MQYAGRKLFAALRTAKGILAFTLITLGVMVTGLGRARAVTRPQIIREIARSGVRLLPMFAFMAGALGLVVIGQAVAWLSRVNAPGILGAVMVLVVVRELGPLFTALLVLSRSGTANVIELGTARALGEVEALEALGVDPVQYLVVPRVIGMALGVFALTMYFIIGSLLSGYLWAFIQQVPLRPGDYFRQIAVSLTWLDFVVLALKSGLFGMAIAVITCYQGLAQPLRLGEVSRATLGAVGQSIFACVLIDLMFILLYLAV
jgi:phospholipid/cholesterol/gamma-HCH transport system permease protein